MNRRGFTLIEVLLAMVLIAGVLVALAMSWRGAALSVAKSRQISSVIQLLQQKATEYEYKYKKEFPTDEAEETGVFEDAKGLSWKVQVKPLEFPDLTPLIIANSDGATDQILLTIVKQMTEFFSKTVFEMKVSVFWTKNERTLEYSVVTYLVNYESTEGLGL